MTFLIDVQRGSAFRSDFQIPADLTGQVITITTADNSLTFSESLGNLTASVNVDDATTLVSFFLTSSQVDAITFNSIGAFFGSSQSGNVTLGFPFTLIMKAKY